MQPDTFSSPIDLVVRSSLLSGVPVKRRRYDPIQPAQAPGLPLNMSVPVAAREEDLVLPADQLAVTVLLSSKLEALLEVLHLVGELVGPAGSSPHTENQAGAAQHQEGQQLRTNKRNYFVEQLSEYELLLSTLLDARLVTGVVDAAPELYIRKAWC